MWAMKNCVGSLVLWHYPLFMAFCMFELYVH